ncbi:hypothetical protein [Halomicrobium urmianum]|nr:hypothetical protein [Halomicrobium urmianum]
MRSADGGLSRVLTPDPERDAATYESDDVVEHLGGHYAQGTANAQ